MGVCNTDPCRVGLLNRPRGSPGLMTSKRQAWLCSSGSKIIRSCSADTQLPCQLLLSEFHLIEAIPIAKSQGLNVITNKDAARCRLRHRHLRRGAYLSSFFNQSLNMGSPITSPFSVTSIVSFPFLNFKYEKASYEECAEVIHKFVKAALIDIRRFYRIILFNFITLNDDAHLKNFSLIERNGEYRLSPAYDLVNTSLQLYEPRIFALDKGLFKEGMSKADTHSIGYDDFMKFGRRIGLTDRVVKQEIKMFQEPNPKAIELIEKSFLSDDLKKQYITAYKFRCRMLNL